MKILNKIGDWIVAKPYRYVIVQWLLYTILFFASTTTVAVIFALITK